MMKDLKVTLHFSEKFHKEMFLNCLTEERLNVRNRKNQVKDLIDHYYIQEVTELDGSIHFSKTRTVNYQSDEERDKFLREIIKDSASRIIKEFLGQTISVFQEKIITEEFLEKAITRHISCAYDASLLELRIKKLKEQN